MPRSWRIVKAKRAASAFDGEGARLAGGRWNSPGTSMIYTAESRALATLEVLVHLNGPELLHEYVLIAVDFPETAVNTLSASALPGGWRAYPAPAALQKLGDGWARKADSIVLSVPSVVAEGERNYLLNPAHPGFKAAVRIAKPEHFKFDLRLLGPRPIA